MSTDKPDEAKTDAELQIEKLLRLRNGEKRQGSGRGRVPQALPATVPPQKENGVAFQVQAPAIVRLEKLGAVSAPKKPASGKVKKRRPHIPVDAGLWKVFQERNRRFREFKTERELWNWALELVLALPPHSHRVGPQRKKALLQHGAKAVSPDEDFS